MMLEKIILLLMLVSRGYSQETCAAQGAPCVQDCDCCGFGVVGGTVCQTRDKAWGPRCYLFKKILEKCEKDSDCRSQNCFHGVCQHKIIPCTSDAQCGGGTCGSHGICIPPPKPPKVGGGGGGGSVGGGGGGGVHPVHPVHRQLCPITKPTDDLTAVVGNLTSEVGTCPCPNPDVYPTGFNPEKLLTDGVYINNYPIGAGFLIRPSFHFPVRKLKICTSDEDPAYDPSSFKVDGRCKGCDKFSCLDEGPLHLPLQRKSCVQITIVDKGAYSRLQYDEIKITFPTQRGGFNTCTGACKDYPLILASVEFLGFCSERNVCKVETRAFEEVVGTYLPPPVMGGCPACHKSTSSDVTLHVGNAICGNIDPWLCYKAKGAGILLSGITKAVNSMKIYSPSSAYGTASDPTSFEIYGGTDKQDFKLLHQGTIAIPAARNDVKLEHFVKIEWVNDQHYELIKIVFPTVQGSFDPECPNHATCKDYPLVIGEIELYGYC